MRRSFTGDPSGTIDEGRLPRRGPPTGKKTTGDPGCYPPHMVHESVFDDSPTRPRPSGKPLAAMLIQELGVPPIGAKAVSPLHARLVVDHPLGIPWCPPWREIAGRSLPALPARGGIASALARLCRG
jgi:hypothetical protein